MKQLWLLIMLTALFVGCSKSDSEGGESPQPEEPRQSAYMEEGYAVIQDESTTRYYESVSENSFVVRADAPAAIVPEVGDIVWCEMTEQTPNGYLARVTSVTKQSEGHYVSTEIIPLSEAIKNLNATLSFDATPSAKEIEDGDGNATDFYDVDDSIWDAFGVEAIQAASATSRGKISPTIAKNFTIEGGGVSGTLYMKLFVTVVFHDDEINALDHVELTPMVGVRLNANFKREGEFEIPLMTLPDIHLARYSAMGITLRPVLKGSLSLGGNNTITLKSNFHYLFFNNKVTMTTKDGALVAKVKEGDEPTEPNGFYATALEMKGALYLKNSLKLQCRIFQEKLLAFGVELSNRYTTSASVSFGMDKNTLATNPVISFTPSLVGTAYCYSKFLSKHFERQEVSISIAESRTVEIPLLPTAKNTTAKYSKTTEVEVNANFVDDRVIDVVESGIALWHEQEAVQHKQRQNSTRSTSSMTFTIPDDDKEYQVSPYVRFEDGSYSYGEKTNITTLIGKWGREDCSNEYDHPSTPCHYIFNSDKSGIYNEYYYGWNKSLFKWEYDGTHIRYNYVDEMGNPIIEYGEIVTEIDKVILYGRNRIALLSRDYDYTLEGATYYYRMQE